MLSKHSQPKHQTKVLMRAITRAMPIVVLPIVYYWQCHKRINGHRWLLRAIVSARVVLILHVSEHNTNKNKGSQTGCEPTYNSQTQNTLASLIATAPETSTIRATMSLSISSERGREYTQRAVAGIVVGTTVVIAVGVGAANIEKIIIVVIVTAIAVVLWKCTQYQQRCCSIAPAVVCVAWSAWFCLSVALGAGSLQHFTRLNHYWIQMLCQCVPDWHGSGT